jgi:outer membrane protein assembly factor BamB
MLALLATCTVLVWGTGCIRVAAAGPTATPGAPPSGAVRPGEQGARGDLITVEPRYTDLDGGELAAWDCTGGQLFLAWHVLAVTCQDLQSGRQVWWSGAYVDEGGASTVAGLVCGPTQILVLLEFGGVAAFSYAGDRGRDPLWVYHLEKADVQPACAAEESGLVYVGAALFDDPRGPGRVTCLGGDGRPIWEREPEHRVSAVTVCGDVVVGAGATRTGPPPDDPWHPSGGRLDYAVLGLDAKSGRALWTVSFGESERLDECWLQKCPDGNVLAATRRLGAMAVDPATGNVLWELRTGDGETIPAPPAVVGESVYVALCGEEGWRIVALRGRLGERQWRTRALADGLAPIALGALSGHIVAMLAPSAEGQPLETRVRIVALSMVDGTIEGAAPFPELQPMQGIGFLATEDGLLIPGRKPSGAPAEVLTTRTVWQVRIAEHQG